MFFQITLFGSNGIDPTKIDNAYQIFPLLLRVVNAALALIGAIAFLYILIAGIQYITAAGVEAKQAEAKKTFTAALIGLFIVLGSFTFTNWLLHRLQFNDTIKQAINNNVKQQDASQQNIIP